MNLDITTTTVCNYGCTYCSEGQHKEGLTKHRLKNCKTRVTVDDIKLFYTAFRRKHKDEKLVISFWGGEPMINWKLCDEVMTEFLEDPSVAFMFYTNGYYIRKYLKRILEIKDAVGARLMIQVSYDGRAINDYTRVTKTGKSTADTCVDAYNVLKENGVNVHYKGTVSPEHFGKLFDSFKEFADQGISYFPTPDCARDYDLDKLPQYLSDLRCSLMRIAKYIYDNNLSPSLFRWFSHSRALCNAGIHNVACDIDGELTACHSAMYDTFSDHRIANIRDIDVIEKIDRATRKYKAMLPKQRSGICSYCNVTFCLKCPALAYELPSVKEKYKDSSYEDRWCAINLSMCTVFKVSNAIAQSLFEAIRRRDSLKKDVDTLEKQ